MSDTHLRVTEHATPVIESSDPDLLYVDDLRVSAGELLTDRDDPSDPAVIVINLSGRNAAGPVTHRLVLRPVDAHVLALQTALILQRGNPGGARRS